VPDERDHILGQQQLVLDDGPEKVLVQSRWVKSATTPARPRAGSMSSVRMRPCATGEKRKSTSSSFFANGMSSM
jgi:hypothetical protein